MRVFDENKTMELKEYDLNRGYLKADKLLVAHYDAVEAVEPVTHLEVIAEYPSGGKETEQVIDVPGVHAVEAYDEYEDILVYVPYTAEEQAHADEQRYKNAIVSGIRKKYGIDDEIAILRQKDTKAKEYAEYSAYCEEVKSEVKRELGL